MKHSLILSGMILWAVSTGLSAQTVTLNGQLLAEDTKQPLPEVAITAISLTKPVSSNLDTTNLGDSLGITTSGTSGYVTLATQRVDPDNKLSATGFQMDVDYVQTITQ